MFTCIILLITMNDQIIAVWLEAALFKVEILKTISRHNIEILLIEVEHNKTPTPHHNIRQTTQKHNLYSVGYGQNIDVIKFRSDWYTCKYTDWIKIGGLFLKVKIAYRKVWCPFQRCFQVSGGNKEEKSLSGNPV